MKLRALILLLAISAAAHAQTFKCTTSAGKIEYRQSACEDLRQERPITGGTTSGIDAISRRDVQRAQAIEANERAQAAANVAAQQEQARALTNRPPSDQEVHNLEVSGSSRTIGKKERDFLQGEARRARAAQVEGSYSERDRAQLESAQKAQNNLNPMERERARRDAESVHLRAGSPSVRTEIIMDRQAADARANARRAAAAHNAGRSLTNCDSAGCWDTSGNRYSRSAGAGNFFRQDGRACRTTAGQVHCD
jgi:hypothetical protein